MGARSQPLTAISFDADDTLWDFHKVMRHALGIALAELQRLVPSAAGELTVEALIAHREQVAAELAGRVVNLEQIRFESFRRTLQHIGVEDDDLAAHLNALYLKHRYEDLELYDDVLPTLDALSQRYRLGILSNGNSYPERVGLDRRFRFVVFAPDHGIAKPDPRLFRVAIERAGCSPNQLLHVGDSLHTDIAGARSAGVRSVWLNRDRRANDTSIQPDFEIASLTELIDVCERIDRR